MNLHDETYEKLPDDMKECIDFHGHLCPGLVYGFMVANQAKKLLNISRAGDEEVAVIGENDSCAIDALQIILGTTAGKGNLVIKNYGKNAYTVFNRKTGEAFRFSKKDYYEYQGENKEEFDRLDKLISKNTATGKEKAEHRSLKVNDLLSRDFAEIFDTTKSTVSEPPLAIIDTSKKCARCGEMTMASKMIMTQNGEFLCAPCHSLD